MLDKSNALFDEVSSIALGGILSPSDRCDQIKGKLELIRKEIARSRSLSEGRPIWHYARSKRPRTDQESIRDFWDSVDKSGECWLWRLGTDSHGYGIFRYNGKPRRVHRLAWTWTNGAVPDGLFVLHKCDTPACVNPDHLFLGTQGDNNNDCIRKARGNRQHGSSRPDAKITEEQARQIFLDARSPIEIGREYGVSDTTVRYIKKRKKWKRATENL